ncbi:uncharacterized protein LOC135708239 [Ochlerotatus camptorhynchus]|uniref:uncharacterized protein LOC135708239 n=1 Tax=Ochlerotatus camptorhynchus TaxID=644619 RepID=UPI0031DDAB9B
MIKITIFILFGAIVSVRCESTILEARQLAYPPYFHSVAYPFGYGWAIAAYVLAVFKAVFVFSMFVIGTFYESGFTRQRDARENDHHENLWMDLIGHFATANATADCWREVQCEAEAYMVSNTLLRILSGFGKGIESDCKRATSRGGCKAITFKDVILGNFKSMYAKGASLLNTFLHDRLS